MSIPTLYIQGTKKLVNERLAKGETIYGQSYGLHGCDDCNLKTQPDGTVIKFFTKYVGGNPYAASYGNWRPAKNKIV